MMRHGEVREILVRGCHAVGVHLRKQLWVPSIHQRHHPNPRISQPREVVLLHQVWWAHGVVSLSVARNDLEAGRAHAARFGAVEVSVVVISPRRPEAVELSDGMTLAHVGWDGLLGRVEAPHEKVVVLANYLRRERPQEYHVGIDDGDDGAGLDLWVMAEPVLNTKRLVVKVVLCLCLRILLEVGRKMNVVLRVKLLVQGAQGFLLAFLTA